MELPNLRQYGASLFQYVVGPVLRACILAALIVYIVGVQTVAGWFADRLPSLEVMTSTEVQAFMKLYGLSTLMPLLVLVIAIALIHGVDVFIFSVARYLPPNLTYRHSILAVVTLGEPLLQMLAQRLHVRDIERLDSEVLSTLRETRRRMPDDERVTWPQADEQRASGALLASQACKTYLLVALLLLSAGALSASGGDQVSRALWATLVSSAALCLAVAVSLRRYRAALNARYQAALSIVPHLDDEAHDPIHVPRYTERWWKVSEVERMRRYLHKRQTIAHR